MWKTIEGYEQYSVSDSGEVRNNITGKILKGSSNGLYRTIMVGGRNYKRYYIHRLVALTFIPIPTEYKDYEIDELEVDHIDGDVNNNSVSNLRWCTRKENCNYDLHKENLSKSLKGKDAWNKGVKRFLSEEAYCEISKKAKERLKDKEKHPMYNKGKKINQYTIDGNFVALWDNAERAAESIGCSSTLIHNCCKNKPHNNSAGGYKWSYVQPINNI